MNQVSITGYITSEPTITEGEKYRVTFLLSPPSRRDGPSDFIPCTIFGTYAEAIVKYLKKGAMIGVVGRIQSRFDSKDVLRTSVVVGNVDLLKPSKHGEAEQTEAVHQEQQYSADVDEADYYAAFSDRGGGYE